jgi:hypothetical protein
LSETQDDVAIVLAGPTHGPQAVEDSRLDVDEALAALTLHEPQRRGLGQRRHDGVIGGGRDGDIDHGPEFRSVALGDRALVADWKNEDREMAAVGEVIASAFASGMSWAGTIGGKPVYCPPPAPALTGKQVMSILESFVADNPDAADKPYGFALSASSFFP